MADGAQWSVPKRATIGRQTLVTGDCLDVLAAMPRASVDVVVTSPPYNLKLAYGAYHDAREDDEYLDWLFRVAASVRDVLKPDGSFFLNLAGSSSRPWVPFEAIVRLRSLFRLQNHINWIKSFGSGVDSVGHYKPVTGRRYVHRGHEHLFHLTRDGDVALDRLSIGLPFKDKSNIARRGHPRDLRCRGNTWFIPYATVNSRAKRHNHPGTFPVELPLWCIYLHGRPDAVVLDPFMGTGTALVAAHYAGASGIGIEIDPAYVEAAHARLKEAAEETMRVTLDQSEMTELLKQDPDTRGEGGFQGLMVGLQDRLNKSTGELTLTDRELERIRSYALEDRNGGWVDRLKAAFQRHLGPNLDGSGP